MPVSTEVLPQRPLIWFVVWGATDAEELCKAVDELAHTADFHPEMPVVVDAKHAECVASPRDLERFCARLERFRERLENRVAVVVGDSMPFMLTRVMALMLEDWSVEVAPFRSVDDALEWVGLGEGPRLHRATPELSEAPVAS